MKLDNDMVAKARSSKKICTIYDDDYVLLYKTMPVHDALLDDYIDRINKLKAKGVNLCGIVDYVLFPETKVEYGDDTSYTKGVFLEERSKGSFLPSKATCNIEGDDAALTYANAYLSYVNEVVKRGEGDFSIYKKLVDDYRAFCGSGLIPDPKPTNFSYDEKLGYSIFDVIPNKDDKYLMREDLINYILGVVFGYEFPYVYSNGVYKFIDQTAYDRLLAAVDKILGMLNTLFLELGFSQEVIDSKFKERKGMIFGELKVIDIAMLEDEFVRLKEEKKEVKKDTSFTAVW